MGNSQGMMANISAVHFQIAIIIQDNLACTSELPKKLRIF